jgi:anaerobic C4-dicarboxylate transporter DcuA
MIGLFSEKGLTQWGLPEILMICVPATLTGVVAAAIVSMFIGKDLKDDPEYQARLAAGKIPAPKASEQRPPLKASAKLSAYLFLAGVALVVLFGFFPSLRTLPGAKGPLAMPIVIEIIMMGVAAVMLLATKVDVDEVPKTATLRAGVVAVIGIFGLAWLGDSFIAAHKDVIVPAIGHWAETAPWTFAFGLFFASVLLYSQAATTRALMPLGIALGIPPQFLIAMFPSVNGYFFIPTYGSLIAAINFDLSGTTRIGRYVLNHSFMIPGVVATAVAVFTGLALARIMF